MGPERELTCKELVELVTDYLEGKMPLEERIRFEEHLVMCEGCRIYLEQMRQTMVLAGALNEDDIAPPGRDRLLSLFKDWKAGSDGGRREDGP